MRLHAYTWITRDAAAWGRQKIIETNPYLRFGSQFESHDIPFDQVWFDSVEI